MATLTIGDKQVTVGDEFLKLAPDQQNATVDEIAKSIGLGAPGRATGRPTNFEFTSPEGKKYTVQGPEGATAEQAFQVLQQHLGGGTAPAAAPTAPAPDIGENRESTIAALRGIPIAGAFTDRGAALLNAALQPIIESGLSHAGTFSERAGENEKTIKAATDAYEASHPIGTTAGKMTMGTLATVPLMAVAPEAMGVAGPMLQMARNGAISGAALSAADAAVRGQDIVDAAKTGGIIGAAGGPVGKGVGKVVSAVADRFRPLSPVTPQNLVNVGGVDVPLSTAEVTQNPALSAEQQVMLRGGRGVPAQERATGFQDLQTARVGEARDNIAAGLDPTGQTARTSPQDAAERIAAELIAQEQARQVAEAGNRSAVASEGSALSRLVGGGQMRASSAFDAGESLSDSLTGARDAAKADYRGKYGLVAEQPGEFAPGSADGFRGDVEAGLGKADRPVSLDETNTPLSLKGLGVIDRRLNAAGPGAVAEVAKPVEAGGLGSQHAKDVADIRARFGDDVAAAYDRQKQAATAAADTLAPAAPKGAQSLLEFLASKGGLGPDAELEAIGAHSHTVNVDGIGRRKLVKQGGWPLDYAREAAEEAGYLRGDHNGTSTVRDLFDSIDGEMRGRKLYPEGYEGTVTKREAAAMSEREQAEFDRHMQGFHDDLAEAGHGEIAPDVHARAVKLMSSEGMSADNAVDHALRQLEQEDAAGAVLTHPKAASDFPGDRAAAAAKAEPAAPGSAFTMREVDQVRKELVTLYGDARRKMMSGGSGSDVYALEHIMEHFDARVRQMVADGKFSGDGPAVLKMQEDARAAFADYKQKFSKRGSGDTVGAAVEKILGKFSDTKATPDEVAKLAYGGATPGGQMPVQIAQRIAKIFGRDSAEFQTYKQGLFARLIEGEPERAAARIDEFLGGTKGRLLSQTVFDAGERARLAQYANRLRGVAPQPNEPGAVAGMIRRYTGADGAPAASPGQIVNDLFGASGRGVGPRSVPLAQELKRRLSPEGWDAVRQGMFEKLTNAGEGKIGFEAQALSQRMHEFLNEGGRQLAETLYSPRELDLMRKLAATYKQMIPVKGTTNPSGTAPMLAKIAGGLRHSLLPLLGLTHGGLPGAALGAIADRGLDAAGKAAAARKATSLFYGPQPARGVDPRFAKGVGLLSSGSLPAINQRR